MLRLDRQPPRWTTKKTLRDHQRRAIAATVAALWSNPLLVLPTGAGKTFATATMVSELNVPTLWLAHRSELIEQAAESLRHNGLHTGIIKSGVEPDPTALVQVASVQTIALRSEIPSADLIIIDEAHRSSADQYRATLDRYGHCPRVGLTATPFRLDGRGLDMFGEIIVGAYVDELVAQGILHAPQVYSIAPPDLRGIVIRAGEFSLEDAQGRLCPPGDVIREWINLANGSQTVGFCPTLDDSRMMAAAFTAKGIPAEHIDGSTPPDERRAILGRLRSRETLVLFNVDILTEGWDLPALECAIIRRPTASLNIHLQSIGRIMRSAPGKQSAVVLDFAGNHHRHGLVTRRIEYSLDGSKKIGMNDPLGLRQCRECFILYESKFHACPHCGYAPPLAERTAAEGGDGTLVELVEDFKYRQAIWNMIEAERASNEYADGWASIRYYERFGEYPVLAGRELVDVNHSTMEEKRAVYEGLAAIAQSKGFSKGWISHRYRGIFGVWPRGLGRDDRAEVSAAWSRIRGNA